MTQISPINRIRILYLAGYMHPSHHRKIELLADHPEFDITHLAFPNSGKSDGWHPSANGSQTYKTIALQVVNTGAQIDPHRFFHRSLDLKMTSVHPDIVHCEQEIESLASLQAVLYQRLFAPAAHFVGYSWQNVNRQHRNPAARMVGKIVLGACDHVLAANHGVEPVLRSQGYAGPVTRSPMFGIDTRHFNPSTQTKPANSQLRVGYVGRLVHDKGIDVVIRAMTKCNFATLSIAGSGPEESSLSALAHDLGLDERITFTGAIPYDSMPAHLGTLDVLVLASRATQNWEEQLGRVLLEAMACGVVVAGANTGAIPEVISGCGCIFDQDDVEALAACLQELHDNPQVRSALAAKGLLHVRQTYCIETLADTICTVWHGLDRRN